MEYRIRLCKPRATTDKQARASNVFHKCFLSRGKVYSKNSIEPFNTEHYHESNGWGQIYLDVSHPHNIPPGYTATSISTYLYPRIRQNDVLSDN